MWRGLRAGRRCARRQADVVTPQPPHQQARGAGGQRAAEQRAQQPPGLQCVAQLAPERVTAAAKRLFALDQPLFDAADARVQPLRRQRVAEAR